MSKDAESLTGVELDRRFLANTFTEAVARRLNADREHSLYRNREHASYVDKDQGYLVKLDDTAYQYLPFNVGRAAVRSIAMPTEHRMPQYFPYHRDITASLYPIQDIIDARLAGTERIKGVRLSWEYGGLNGSTVHADVDTYPHLYSRMSTQDEEDQELNTDQLAAAIAIVQRLKWRDKAADSYTGRTYEQVREDNRIKGDFVELADAALSRFGKGLKARAMLRFTTKDRSAVVEVDRFRSKLRRDNKGTWALAICERVGDQMLVTHYEANIGYLRRRLGQDPPVEKIQVAFPWNEATHNTMLMFGLGMEASMAELSERRKSPRSASLLSVWGGDTQAQVISSSNNEVIDRSLMGQPSVTIEDLKKIRRFIDQPDREIGAEDIVSIFLR